MGDPATSRRSRGPLLLTVLSLSLATAPGGCAVVWLAVHVLAEASDVEGVELLKIALTAGLSRWAAAAQVP